jgi:integrase
MLKTDASGEDHAADHYVSGNPIGQRIGSIDNAFSRACKRADIVGLHVHDLRREAGSRRLERGVPLNVVKELLGHTNISQTSTYLGVSEAGVYEAMQRLWTPAAPIASRARTRGIWGHEPP